MKVALEQKLSTAAVFSHRHQVFLVGAGEIVGAVAPGDEVEIGNLGGIKHGLKTFLPGIGNGGGRKS